VRLGLAESATEADAAVGHRRPGLKPRPYGSVQPTSLADYRAANSPLNQRSKRASR